jgi:hypothetical protein
MNKYLDWGTVGIIVATLILFIAALFVKGLTHDILLEAGVFLVSAKLILMGYKNHVAMHEINSKLDHLIRLSKKESGPLL